MFTLTLSPEYDSHNSYTDEISVDFQLDDDGRLCITLDNGRELRFAPSCTRKLVQLAQLQED